MIGWCDMSFEEIVGLIPEIISETICPLLEATYDTVCNVVDSIKDCIEENFQEALTFYCLAIEKIENNITERIGIKTTYNSKKSYNKSKQ